MYSIIDKRGTGKTCRLILLAKETGATIVSACPACVELKAESLGISGIKAISYDDFMDDFSSKKYLIDELECFLNYMYPNQIVGYTMSEE